MKHKRQTLGKQEDGDDKDSVTSEGSKSAKLSDKFQDDEMMKKSCQGCEMPSASLCGTHDEIPDLSSNRGNNNNTPSATNNNTNFNNNSNGASSEASAGSFDKLITEEDSRSNEDNGVHLPPKSAKKNSAVPTNVSIKLENRRSSPNTCERKINVKKVSPSPGLNKEGVLPMTHDNISVKMSPKSATTLGTPSVQPNALGT